MVTSPIDPVEARGFQAGCRQKGEPAVDIIKVSKGRRFLVCFLAPTTVRRAFRVALVVGPILGMINHFDLLFGETLTTMRVVKICVTFVVPYCVSAYSSATTMMAERG